MSKTSMSNIPKKQDSGKDLKSLQNMSKPLNMLVGFLFREFDDNPNYRKELFDKILNAKNEKGFKDLLNNEEFLDDTSSVIYNEVSYLEDTEADLYRPKSEKDIAEKATDGIKETLYKIKKYFNPNTKTESETFEERKEWFIETFYQFPEKIQQSAEKGYTNIKPFFDRANTIKTMQKTIDESPSKESKKTLINLGGEYVKVLKAVNTLKNKITKKEAEIYQKELVGAEISDEEEELNKLISEYNKKIEALETIENNFKSEDKKEILKKALIEWANTSIKKDLKSKGDPLDLKNLASELTLKEIESMPNSFIKSKILEEKNKK